MLSKDKRLNLRKEFKWVASGEKVENNILKLFIKFGDNVQPRVGIAVSSSTFKKAVDRNRARRLIATGFQDFYFKLPQNVNLIAMPKAEVLGLGSGEVTIFLKQLLEQKKLLVKE
ncbi:MAG: ribonuclease P protein component [Patescibacteria group bacterium]|nr:ribonuclease P protein component [Patescibacteria group bacterium]